MASQGACAIIFRQHDRMAVECFVGREILKSEPAFFCAYAAQEHMKREWHRVS